MSLGAERHSRGRILATLIAQLLLITPLALADNKPDLKPGYNFYSPREDAELGQEYSAQVDRQLPLLDDAGALNYLNNLGKKLVAFAPENQPDYVWKFRIVNSGQINAFALPGGYIYVNRGVFDAAENEAQLAGVIAHESGHVVMRHGTHIASQALVAEGGLALVGSILGQRGNIASQLAQLGLGLGVDSLLLKNSRAAETQADEVGAYILYRAGYDPHAMAQFFQIVARKYPQRTLQFFSDHPNPENRIQDVDKEIAQFGAQRAGNMDDSAFEGIKQSLATLSPPPERKGTPKIDAGNHPPPLPSESVTHYQCTMFALDYPDNWQVQHAEDTLEIFPPGGMVTGAEGETSQAYGASVSLYEPQQGKNWGLIDATQELLDSMRQSNPQLQVLQQTGMTLRGSPAVSTLLQNDSPVQGQRETDHLVTVRRRDAVLAFVFVAPAGSFQAYAPTFDKILQSIDLAR